MKDHKQLFVSELKSATVQKKTSFVKMFLFTKDLRKLGNRDFVRAVTPSNYINKQDDAVADHF